MSSSIIPTTTVSVAMATFNGERYLAEQLESIARQSRPPDELLIGDDQSSDATERIVAAFAARATFPVHFVRNERRLGSSQNFAALLERSRADIVLLSDQDDVWSERRVERSLDVLAAHPRAAFTFSNARLIDDAGAPLAGTLWDRAFFGSRAVHSFAERCGSDVLLRTNVVTGATMALRRPLVASALPIPKGWVHDGWLAIVLEHLHGAVPIDEPWISYRVHAAQQIGVVGLSLHGLANTVRRQDAAFYRREAANFRTLAERLRELDPRAGELADRALAKASFLERRAAGREHLGHYVRGLGHSLLNRDYMRHGLGLKQVLFDMAGASDAAARRALSRARGRTRR